MSRRFNYERAARALVDASLMGDRRAAEKYEISPKSLEGWRSRMSEDPKLREFFQEFREQKRGSWATELPDALSSCITFLKHSVLEAAPGNPEAIAAVASALKILAEVEMTQKLIEARMEQEEDDESEPIGSSDRRAGAHPRSNENGFVHVADTAIATRQPPTSPDRF